MACCKNVLGLFPHNKAIDTGIAAAQTGTHVLQFTGPNFTRFSKAIWVSSGNNIVIPQGVLNEDCVYEFEIIQPDAVLMEQAGCETFSLQTFINKMDCDDLDYL